MRSCTKQLNEKRQASVKPKYKLLFFTIQIPIEIYWSSYLTAVDMAGEAEVKQIAKPVFVGHLVPRPLSRRIKICRRILGIFETF